MSQTKDHVFTEWSDVQRYCTDHDEKEFVYSRLIIGSHAAQAWQSMTQEHKFRTLDAKTTDLDMICAPVWSTLSNLATYAHFSQGVFVSSRNCLRLLFFHSKEKESPVLEVEVPLSVSTSGWWLLTSSLGGTTKQIKLINSDTKTSKNFTVHVASPKVLASLKRSHIYWTNIGKFPSSPKVQTLSREEMMKVQTSIFDKNIADLHYLEACARHQVPWSQHQQAILDIISKKRYEETKEYMGGDPAAHVNLNQSNENFLDPNKLHIPTIWDHDEVHRIVMFGNAPLYTRIKKDQSKAMCDEKMFLALTLEERIQNVQEEAMVLALERYLLPCNTMKPTYLAKSARESYKKALERICTSITKNWFRAFAIDHYFEILNLPSTKDLMAYRNEIRAMYAHKFEREQAEREQQKQAILQLKSEDQNARVFLYQKNVDLKIFHVENRVIRGNVRAARTVWESMVKPTIHEKEITPYFAHHFKSSVLGEFMYQDMANFLLANDPPAMLPIELRKSRADYIGPPPTLQLTAGYTHQEVGGGDCYQTGYDGIRLGLETENKEIWSWECVRETRLGIYESTGRTLEHWLNVNRCKGNLPMSLFGCPEAKQNISENDVVQFIIHFFGSSPWFEIYEDFLPARVQELATLFKKPVDYAYE
jgi:hypothetical protein